MSVLHLLMLKGKQNSKTSFSFNLALYAPGSQAQQRICRFGSRSLAGIGSLSSTSQSPSRGLPHFRRSRTQGSNSLINQSQTGIRQGIRREGIGPSSHLQWDQMRTQVQQRFPGRPLQISGHDVRVQSQLGFPELSPMSSLGNQSPQSDSLPSGLSTVQGLTQTSSFSPMSGQQGFNQGPISFGKMDEQRFDVGGSRRSQGQPGFLGQFSSGQRGPQGEASFNQGLHLPSFSDRSFRQSGSGSFRAQSLGNGQQIFSGGSPVAGGLPLESPSVDGGRSFGREQTFGRGQSLGTGQSLHGGQSFGGVAFGQLSSGVGRGSAPQPFLVEQPPISATSISGSQDQSQPLISQTQQPRP